MKWFTILLFVFSHLACAADSTSVRWTSEVTGGPIAGTVHAATSDPAPLVVYLTHLSMPRLGKESNASLIDSLAKAGTNVLLLDYAGNSNAAGVKLCADVLKLRTDLTKKEAPLQLPGITIDPARIFILPEGYRLLQNVEFARDGDRVLAMDIACPSQPESPVSLLMEITCDNQNRMGTSSLLFCHDALLEGGMFCGFATAMIDHPVPPPYKGLDDPMPQCIHRLKSAVRTLRSMSKELNLSGKIGVIGFSRGGPMAAILAVSNGRMDLEGEGAHADQSSDVQAALIHGNRYDYLDLLPDDPMLKRFEKAWGPLAENREKWAAHGAAAYLRETAAPMFLNTSDAESPEYRDGLEKFAKRLSAINSTIIYQRDPDNRGHRVTTDPATLQKIYRFFSEHLR